MADAVLSAFLPVLFQSVSDFVKNELLLGHHIEEERKRLISNMDMIQAILLEAEKKTQLTEPQKLLVASLKDASNDGIEALDDHFYEVQRRQVMHFAGIRNSISAINPSRMIFNHSMEKKMMDFTRSIECVKNTQEMCTPFQLDVQGHRGRNYEGGGLGPSTLLPPTVVCGRHDDCNNILDKLLQPYLKSNVAVLPILGEPYIGKTTVAQLVLNDERASMHFELTLWVHVSPDFNIERITSSIIESVEGYPFHSDNLNTLQTRLEKLLRGRRYLLVLDDYWSNNWEDWDKLKRSFVSGAQGSKILVTTRSGTVAQVLGTLAPYKLKHLKEEDCWLLFCQCAQGTESYAHNYEDIQDSRLKQEVLRKCKGVPFIAASLGYSINLHGENDISKWPDILREEKWDCSDDHFHKALRLSYAQLDYHLKPCFAYSSIIPQKYLFEEEWLIQHWMAQGFIVPNPNTGQTMEDTGRSYFSSLVTQSFFQTAHVDRTGQQRSYSLSEMMLKLALHVSREDCKCYVVEGPCSLPEKVRYLTVIFNKPASQDLFKEISGGEHLHTLIVVGGSEDFVLKIPNDIGQRFIRLRTLDLSNFCVAELPKSIGEMKYLRCLQLRSTKIRRLPESICRLYLLQTLGLRNCYDLEELPSELKKLRKLRHIDLVMTCNYYHNICRLKSMPKDIGLLTDLQTLSRFVISQDRGGIAELAELNNLHGELLISNLHLVEDVEEVARANLASKQFLQKLELSWSNNNKQAEQVLQHLKPPINIKELTISGYTGMACPSWLSSSEYTNLVTVCLYDFKGSSVLPPLGLLPLLENLHLKSWERLVSIHCSEFCGCTAGFQSLKKLHLEKMGRLRLWEGDERCVFPRLDELVIENCCMLEQVTHSLPSLTKITVDGSPALLGLPNFPSLKYVNLKESGEWIWGSWRSLSFSASITLCQLPTVHFPLGSGLKRFHSSLQRLEINHCEKLETIPDDWPPCNLIHFSLRHCPQLRELPKGIQRLQALEDMEIIDCGMLTHLPEISGLSSLIRLEVAGCGSIRSLPHIGFPSSMQFLSINRCYELAWSCKYVETDRVKIDKIFSVWIDGREVSTSAQQGRTKFCYPSKLQ